LKKRYILVSLRVDRVVDDLRTRVAAAGLAEQLQKNLCGHVPHQWRSRSEQTVRSLKSPEFKTSRQRPTKP